MLSLLALLLLSQAAAAPLPAPAAWPGDDAYRPLGLYDGSWQVTPGTAGHATDNLVNKCTRMPHFYACEQTVNGKFSALVLFVPAEKAGHYYTQPILPDGHATGRGDLDIAGDHWTYLGKDTDAGKTTYYRTTNEFRGQDHIHFEQAQSADGQKWDVKNSGDETRMAATQ